MITSLSPGGLPSVRVVISGTDAPIGVAWTVTGSYMEARADCHLSSAWWERRRDRRPNRYYRRRSPHPCPRHLHPV